ncbi:fimbrial protein [Pseudomonas yamanorum]|uniref:Fimbrial protein n=1 Tax=Pseudomonas yamanorum TaxID=515393 RepID=A0A7Y8JSC0_9PSED|nr:fimbrial protein [Pseudomonas yamanorum]NWE16893.1 fimbrial protein [Pseudomonas yamanorum]
MTIKKLTLMGCLFLTGLPDGYAMICRTANSKVIKDTLTITETITIPNSVAAKTILWRQPVQNVDLECWVDAQGSPTENVFLYAKNIDLGPDIETGVTFQGNDYFSSTNAKVDTGWSISGCPVGTVCGSQTVQKTLTYSIFFAKKSDPGVPKDGPAANVSAFLAFQLDGKGGTRPSNETYNVTARGMKFRYLPCQPKISITPSAIDFGPIEPYNAKDGATIKQVPFTINEDRTCNAVYGLNAKLEPLTSTLSSDKSTLIPDDNNSVGIKIINSDNQQPIEFKKEFLLIPETLSMKNSRAFVARLIWMTASPTPGAFNAGAILNVYYR